MLPIVEASVASPIIKISLENFEVKSYGFTGAHFLPFSIRPAFKRRSGAFCLGIILAILK